MAAPSPTSLNELRSAIESVVDYLWEPERESYREARQEMGRSGSLSHIFHMLVALNNWVHDLDEDPDEIADDLESIRSRSEQIADLREQIADLETEIADLENDDSPLIPNFPEGALREADPDDEADRRRTE